MPNVRSRGRTRGDARALCAVQRWIFQREIEWRSIWTMCATFVDVSTSDQIYDGALPADCAAPYPGGVEQAKSKFGPLAIDGVSLDAIGHSSGRTNARRLRIGPPPRCSWLLSACSHSCASAVHLQRSVPRGFRRLLNLQMVDFIEGIFVPSKPLVNAFQLVKRCQRSAAFPYA